MLDRELLETKLAELPLFQYEFIKTEELLFSENIRYICLVMSEKYIRKHFDDIKKFANIIENRLDDSDCTLQSVLADNAYFKENAKHFILIDDNYKNDTDFQVLGL